MNDHNGLTWDREIHSYDQSKRTANWLAAMGFSISYAEILRIMQKGTQQSKELPRKREQNHG